MIRIGKRESGFDKVRWVLLARSIDLSRPVFTYLFSDAENIVATDGKRIHLAKKVTEKNNFFGEPIPEGYYEVVKNTTQEIVLALVENPESSFPDYKVVMPDKSLGKALLIERQSGIENTASYAMAMYARQVERGYLPWKSVKDIFSISADFTMYTTTPMSVVLFEDEGLGLQAVVMPWKG
jgi:hypothetical protein